MHDAPTRSSVQVPTALGGLDRYSTPMDRRVDPRRDLRINAKKEHIALRLRPVLPTMPAEEFEKLITRMAEVEIKYEMRRELDALRVPKKRDA